MIDNGWIKDGWTDGWTECGWMDRWTDPQISIAEIEHKNGSE
jgi:hypothetical protein